MPPARGWRRPAARRPPASRRRAVHLRTTLAGAARLDEALAAWLPGDLGRPLSRALLRRLILAGVVRVDGRPLRAPGRPLASGTRLEVDVDPSRLPPVPSGAPIAPEGLAVLYEDRFLIAVDKPPGLPTVPTADPSRPHLVGLVTARLRNAGGGEKPYLGVHQRLDRDTSGVVLFAKDRAANAGLAASFAEGRVRKTYVALTVRPRRLPPRAWQVDAALARAGRGRMRTDPGGAPALTELRLVDVLARALRVEARPRTGRTHQVRVHLAASGAPVLGDATYGGALPPAPAAPRVMLHALRLELTHPVTGTPLRIECGEPPDFRRLLSALSSP